jgi:hypothetical protein
MYGTTGITCKARPVVTLRYAEFQCFTAVAAEVHLFVFDFLGTKFRVQGSKVYPPLAVPKATRVQGFMSFNSSIPKFIDIQSEIQNPQSKIERT